MISDIKNPKIIPVHICVLIPENNSMESSGKSNVLKKVIQHTIPFSILLAKSSLIFLILMRGRTAKMTIIPNVASGKLNKSGVAYNKVIITIIVVVIDDIGLYDPTDSFTADLENEPDTG